MNISKHQLFTNLIIIVAFAIFSVSIFAEEKPTLLFDGQSLDDWEVIPRDQQWWTVTDGAISGGSLKKKVPYNTFIATKKSYQNFDLTLKIRIQGTEGFINSGIQIRSVRVQNSSEMSGYQVDAGKGWWGKLYDESRRNKVVGQAADLETVNKAVDENGWNEYRIRAEGKRIQSWINGVPALDYTEKDAGIPLDGQIGFQVHGGGKALVQIKEITIIRLPPTPGVMTWEKFKQRKKAPTNKVAEQMSVDSTPLSPEEELRGFEVPEGFEVELVASESEEIGKFITVAFDAQARMWTMTAFEYPVDANENAEASQRLFANGGRDKILVFDQPFGKQISKPRVFVDGLVMPLGILPYKDGVYVQYGNDIRLYRDTNADGKADKHEVILTGFGTQDSHLFPHQFTRTPGGWILVAQGLFNRSKVRRPDGHAFASGPKVISFDQCKLARFTHDGSDFETLTAGPNNIWGLTISREGETWLQEANDIGYPIIPYEPGGYYKTGSQDKLRSYQPLMPPPLAPPQMGGTGLSGLAIADDRDGWSYPWGLKNAKPNGPRIFYVANPITSSIQIIRATPDRERYRYEKLPDFLTSKDSKFRPVAIQFGPDGCLYVTDWYNKIISHNEVPRNHPARDKTRGRIWRIRQKKQPRIAPPNLSEIPSVDLLTHLGSPNARIADLTWQEIVDRDAKELIPKLKQLIIDEKTADDKRLGALWALEGVSNIETSILMQLAIDSNANIRHEAIRIAAAQPRSNSQFLEVAQLLIDDPSPKVRAALGDALKHVQYADEKVVALMLQLGKPPLSGDKWDSYDREFERYLARWAMERNAEAVSQFINSPEGKAMPLESRLLATLAIGGNRGAIGLVELIPKLKRSLAVEEIQLLASQFNEPTVAKAMIRLLENPVSRNSTLQTLLALRTTIDTQRLHSTIESATLSLWSQATTDNEKQFALKIAGAFQLHELDEKIATYARTPQTKQKSKLLALKALRELGSNEFKILSAIALSEKESQQVRDAAMAALAESSSEQAVAAMSDMLMKLNYENRQAVIVRMATSRNGALSLLDSIEKEDISAEDLSPAILETMLILLPENEELKELWSDVAGQVQSILRLPGGKADFVQKPIKLSGAFTVETWVRLDPDISNADGILGNPGVLDMNFAGKMFRVWIANQNDIVIAKHTMVANSWVHIAVTRDDEGTFRIYINGELSAQSKQKSKVTFNNLQIGRTSPRDTGTKGAFFEYRIWDIARTPRQIRDNIDLSFSEKEQPAELVHYFSRNNWGPLSGQAKIQSALDAPKLLSIHQATVQAALFDKYRQLANEPGNALAGKALFEKSCLVCHQQAGNGGKIGPPLDGIGLKGTEAILRNILTPNVAIEGGYRSYRVLTRSGKVIQGLLVSQDSTAVVLRQPNTADQRIEKSKIEQAGFTSVSVMPGGLLDNLKPQEVSDLFAHLHSLKQNK